MSEVNSSIPLRRRGPENKPDFVYLFLPTNNSISKYFSVVSKFKTQINLFSKNLPPLIISKSIDLLLPSIAIHFLCIPSYKKLF